MVLSHSRLQKHKHLSHDACFQSIDAHPPHGAHPETRHSIDFPSQPRKNRSRTLSVSSGVHRVVEYSWNPPYFLQIALRALPLLMVYSTIRRSTYQRIHLSVRNPAHTNTHKKNTQPSSSSRYLSANLAKGPVHHSTALTMRCLLLTAFLASTALAAPIAIHNMNSGGDIDETITTVASAGSVEAGAVVILVGTGADLIKGTAGTVGKQIIDETDATGRVVQAAQGGKSG